MSLRPLCRKRNRRRHRRFGRSLQRQRCGRVRQILPIAIQALKPMTDDIRPISSAERMQRIAKAQRLMQQQKMDAIFMEGTTACEYFADMRWGQSGRTFGIVIPAKGEIAYVCPKFEEDRAMELIKTAFGTDVRCWEEHESPYSIILGIVKDRGVKYRTIGME